MNTIVTILIVVVILALFSYFMYRMFKSDKNGKNPKAASTSANAETKNVFFYSNSCGYCKQVKPVADRLKAFGLQHVELSSALASKHGINGVPAFVKIDGNDRVVKRYSGDRSFEDLKKFIES